MACRPILREGGHGYMSKDKRALLGDNQGASRKRRR